MNTPKTVRIGNGAGFAGDNFDAPRLLAESGNLDYLTLEFLAELTLSVLAYQKQKNSEAGFIGDTPNVVASLAGEFKKQSHLKLVTNGGGMNPSGCAAAVAAKLCESELEQTRLASCSGDDLLPRIDELISQGEEFINLETGEPLGDRRALIASANAYLGAEGIVRALEQDARIVVTGRIADASLLVGPAIHEFGWSFDDWLKLGRATVAGHLIECGAQATGGMFSRWNPNGDISLDQVGYPIAELSADGNCAITMNDNADGIVNVQTLSEQLVYEIGDPANYLTPDVTADFREVRFAQLGKNRVSVDGGNGKAAPETYKVSLAFHDGFMVSGMIVFCGPNAVANARSASEMIRQRLARAGIVLDRFHAEVLGAGDTFSGPQKLSEKLREGQPWDVVLRISGHDQNRDSVDRLARELAPLVTSGPPGVTGYTGARPRSHPVLAFWPTAVSRDKIEHQVEVRSASDW